MKLLLLVEVENKGNTFLDFYINEDKIDGFWIESELYENEIGLINLVVNGQVYSVVKNKDLEYFLDKKFNIGYYNKIELK